MFGIFKEREKAPLCGSAMEVAEYLIQNAEGYPMTNLRLGKSLFFVQGLCLAKTGRRCFPDVVEAWTRGPAVYSVYRETKRYGGNPLPVLNPYAKYAFAGTELEKLLNAYLEWCKDLTTDQLVKISMSEKSPWRKAERFYGIPPKDIGVFVDEMICRGGAKELC